MPPLRQNKIVFLEVEPEDETKIRKSFPQAQIANHPLKPEEIIKKYKDAEILCCFIYTKITKEVIKALPNLKLIITRSVGYDHIDLKTAQEQNIPICNVPDYGAHVIAEHVFALLLSTIRRIEEGDKRVEQNNFDFHGLRGITLKGKTMGVIGTGKIGKNVCRIASMGFLMNVLATDPFPDKDAALNAHFKYTNLDTILKKSDIITLHAPLLSSTKHLIDHQSIKKMKPGVILVNTARGGLLDTQALIEGIKSGKIAHAALDVLEHEKNITKHQELIHLPQVVITPHTAFYADDSMQKMYEEAIASIQRFLTEKKLIHQVYGQ